jgi:CRP/FNR family transcriptional regulator, cyclic AMP receptor protein
VATQTAPTTGDERRLPPHPAAPPARSAPVAVRLSDVVAELADDPERRWRALGCRTVELPAGPLPTASYGAQAAPRLAILLSGCVLRRTQVHSRAAVEILDDGDVLDLRPAAGGDLVAARTELVAYPRAGLAVLGRGAIESPLLRAAVDQQLAEQCRRASMHMAILQLPRVADRIVAVFADLAERRGRMTGSGILVDIPLTHRLIGSLAGARRPTVSLALTELSEAGLLSRREDGAWLLSPEALDAWRTVGTTSPAGG